jgi:hypothetical protein
MKRAIQEVKDTKGSSEVVIEEEQTTQCPKEKGKPMTYKPIHRKLKIEQHEPH